MGGHMLNAFKSGEKCKLSAQKQDNMSDRDQLENFMLFYYLKTFFGWNYIY